MGIRPVPFILTLAAARGAAPPQICVRISLRNAIETRTGEDPSGGFVSLRIKRRFAARSKIRPDALAVFSGIASACRSILAHRPLTALHLPASAIDCAGSRIASFVLVHAFASVTTQAMIFLRLSCPLYGLLISHPAIGSSLATANRSSFLRCDFFTRVSPSAVIRTRRPVRAMKSATVAGSKDRRKIMAYIITQAELEHFNDAELKEKFNAILADLARRNMAAADCPLATATLENIRQVLLRRRARRPQGPRF